MIDATKIIRNSEISGHIAALKNSLYPLDAILVLYNDPVDTTTVRSDVVDILKKSKKAASVLTRVQNSHDLAVEPVKGGNGKVFAVKSPGIAQIVGNTSGDLYSSKVPGGTPPPPRPQVKEAIAGISNPGDLYSSKVPGGTPPPPPPQIREILVVRLP